MHWMNGFRPVAMPLAIWIMTAAGVARADALAEKLGPFVGETLDLVELGTGRRFVRPVLEGLVEKDEAVTGLRLRAEGQKTVSTVSLASVAKVVAGRETVHESQASGKTFSQLRGKKAREAYDRQVEESAARMKANGVAPWPRLAAEQHAAEVESLEAFVAEVRQRFPKLQVSETHEFLVASDIPPAQLAPYVTSLDTMHDFLCDLYGIPKGEPLWKGKCLVIAFLDESDYTAFESAVMKSNLRGTHGVCHQRSDGRVITACHRGEDPAAFAHMLVHETSHGFNHRWISPQRLPNWLNEGIAECVGARVVKNCNQVPLKEAAAVAYLRSQGTLGPNFFTAANIDSVQYGMASGMVRMLISRDAKKFAEFVRGIKEGTPVEQSLERSYGGSLDDLVRGYGATVGVSNLSRGPK